jgi:hypothetical protein
MERECAAWFARHLDLPAGDRAIAQDANALIVERMPFPTQIGRLEKREFVFWKQWFVHLGSVRIKAGPKALGHRHWR